MIPRPAIEPRPKPGTANLVLDARDVERLDELLSNRPECEHRTRGRAVRAAIDSLAYLIRDDPLEWTAASLMPHRTPIGYRPALLFGAMITASQRADLAMIAAHLRLQHGLGESAAVALRLLCDAYDCPR